MAPFLTASLLVHAALAVAAMYYPAIRTGRRTLPNAIPVSIVRLSGPRPAPAPPRPAPTGKKKEATVPKPVVPARPKKKPVKKKREAVPPAKEEIREEAPSPKADPEEDTPRTEDGQPTGGEPGPEPEFTGAGSGDGSSSVASLDILGNEYDWYTASITARLKESWNRPLLGGATRALTVVVSFTIHKDGRVTDVGIQAGSGVPSIDRSALRAVYDAAPLPRIPPQLHESTLPARFEFRWHPGR